MPRRVQHLLETRFSVWMEAGAASFSRAWLDERLELLRRFCLPSVAAQTTDEFAWLLLCDESTDPDVIDALRAHEHETPTLELVTTAPDRPPLAAIRQLVRPDTDVLITTRLDSDDAIADDYIAAIQHYAPHFHHSPHHDLVLNFPRGYRLDAQVATVDESRMDHSPFHSLFERPRQTTPKTVFDPVGGTARARHHGNHLRLHSRHATHQDESIPSWLKVMHGNNVGGVALGATWRHDAPDAVLAGFTLRSDGRPRWRGATVRPATAAVRSD